MAISLIMVPLTLHNLDNSTFGVWTTLSSLLLLLAFFDVGLGNGLRNRLTEALSNNDTVLARSYISTAYVLFGLVQIILIVIFLLVNLFIPWSSILNTNLDESLLRKLSFVLFIGISIKLFLDLLTFALYAKQETAKAGLLLFLSNLAVLLGLLLLIHLKKVDILTLGILHSTSPILILVIASLLFYTGSLKSLRPTFSLARRQFTRGLLGLGSKFFVIQLAGLIIFYSDNLIITQLFGPSEVTPYNIAFRYFNIINTLFAIALAPFWSAYTEAYVKGEFSWMKSNYRRLWWLWYGVVALVVCWIIAAPMVYDLWVGKRVQIPSTLTLCMGLYVVIACLNNVTVVVTNGLGKIKLQLIAALFSAAVNIPLSIFFSNVLELGIAGVILATSISLLNSSAVGLIQAKRIINQTASGIWNQ